VLISLALGTGLREHEVLALDYGDVFDEDGRARRRVTLRGTGEEPGMEAEAIFSPSGSSAAEFRARFNG
jgi:integrase/recombinase XerC